MYKFIIVFVHSWRTVSVERQSDGQWKKEAVFYASIGLMTDNYLPI
ncbi:MAG: hypothetical protein U0X91_04385 [Spirosomataceae bacterium]